MSVAAAVAIIGVALVSAATMTGAVTAAGAPVDQTPERVALVCAGIVLALIVWWLGTRPLVRADATAIEIRHITGDYTLPWSAVTRIRVPRGELWANLELDNGDVVGLSAVQSIDGTPAVTAVTALRALHAAARQPSSHR
ncbi:PH domain-containing protein [Planosporangium flavigriseum]|uniref:Low molecular weight protein antigen 6 PH domain-containing protein n=1 Tax=Planosporangium flavigriseum TaxID=373681 RepID=A0A8J3M3V6_9ACTN|nr:PH domain-containing protein [Planosporangium flavigriseum]NJC66197.1 PH domain-containing protein [Planosporangium flavigriseum]GIG76425.1 hypothetical protein Pfl04_48290 [Planosporangium flavigriseum]